MRPRRQPALVPPAALGLLLALSSLPASSQAGQGSALAPATVQAAPKSLFLVGDGSLAAAASAPNGAGALGSLFRPDRINVVNAARPDRTIRTYITVGDWAAVLARLHPGDVVLLQFAPATGTPAQDALPGIGDETREVDDRAAGQRELVHTFGWYLREFAVETLARGATPVLCAPRPASSPSHAAAWVRDIALQQRLAFVPLATPAGAASSPDTEAAAIVAGLKALPSDPLAGYFSAQAAPIPAAPPAGTP